MSTRHRGRTDSKTGSTSTKGKEAGREFRYTVVVGEDFLDLTQPSKRDLLLGKLKKGMLWLAAIVLGALITAFVTAVVSPIANALVEKILGAR